MSRQLLSYGRVAGVLARAIFVSRQEDSLRALFYFLMTGGTRVAKFAIAVLAQKLCIRETGIPSFMMSWMAWESDA